jgi:hypothetical protein
MLFKSLFQNFSNFLLFWSFLYAVVSLITFNHKSKVKIVSMQTSNKEIVKVNLDLTSSLILGGLGFGFKFVSSLF